jgi:hypothetical protein
MLIHQVNCRSHVQWTLWCKIEFIGILFFHIVMVVQIVNWSYLKLTLGNANMEAHQIKCRPTIIFKSILPPLPKNWIRNPLSLIERTILINQCFWETTMTKITTLNKKACALLKKIDFKMKSILLN